MKRLLTTTLALALAAPLTPVWAGDKDKEGDCEQSAATCAQMMKQKFADRGWVGINMNYDKEKHAVAITNVVANSPASRAGFQVGDVLRGLNGVEYTEDNEEALRTEYAGFKPGNKATFTVERASEIIDITVELEQIPEVILAQWIGQHVLEHHQSEAEMAETETEEPAESP